MWWTVHRGLDQIHENLKADQCVTSTKFIGPSLGLVTNRTVKAWTLMAWTLTRIYWSRFWWRPLTAIFTIDCIPSCVTKSIEWISNLDLWTNHRVPYHPWLLKRFELWRGQRDFEERMPALWPNVFRLLTPSFETIITRIQPCFRLPCRGGGISWNKSMNRKHQNLLAQRESRGTWWLSSWTLTRRRFPITSSLWTQRAFLRFSLPSEDWNNAVATAMVLSATVFASSFRNLVRACISIGNDLQHHQLEVLWCCLAWCLSGHVVCRERRRDITYKPHQALTITGTFSPPVFILTLELDDFFSRPGCHLFIY